MVHALRQAHRVLKPNGLLLDLRPWPGHRRVGLSRSGRWRPVSAMRETFEDDRAANRAVAQALREGLFRRERQTRFDLERRLDTLKDLRLWVKEFVRQTGLPSHDWVIERVERALESARQPAKIVVRGLLGLSVMRKVG